MANVRKFSSMKDIGHLCAHYARTVQPGHYSNRDIKENLTHNDYNLAPDRGKQTDYIKQKITEIQDGRTLRKDAVRMCCWVVDAPAAMPEDKKNDFFQAAYNFLVDRYGSISGLGEDIVISAYVHKDESTDHLHFAFLPIIDRSGQKSFCAKEVVGKADLKTFHDDLGNYMEKHHICRAGDIKNGKTIRDSSGRALSVRELKNRSRIRERTLSSRWTLNEERSRKWTR